MRGAWPTTLKISSPAPPAKDHKDGLSGLKYWDGEPDFPYSPGVSFLRNHLQVFEQIDDDTTVEKAQVQIIRRVVKNVAHIMAAGANLPSSEADVQKVLHAHLRVGLPDARREASVSQPTKTYKPDIAIDWRPSESPLPPKRLPAVRLSLERYLGPPTVS